MGRGGRGGGGGGRNPANQSRETQVSRKVSWLLRHGAGSEGLKLGKGGYVNVQDALNTKTLRALGVTFPELREMVANNDKQRYSMIPQPAPQEAPSGAASPVLQEGLEAEAEAKAKAKRTGPSTASDNPADYLIRANQGHSIQVDTDDLLTPITHDAGNVPEVVVHGTDEPAWALILQSGGLRRMGRNHIHFAAGLPAGFRPLPSTGSAADGQLATTPVISGMRKNASVLVYVDIHAALAAGIAFFVSDNGVILTAGDAHGLLPYTFFRRVESRKAGGAVLMADGKLPEGVVVDVEAWEKETRKGKRGGRGGRGEARGSKTKAVDDSRDLMAGVSAHPTR